MFKRDEQISNDVETIIGPSVNVEGDFVAAGNVVVEGTISGTLKTENNLTVGEHAKITADITAGRAVISGEIHGNIRVKEDLELMSTAKIFGDIKTKTLSVAPGAVINGKCVAGDESAVKIEKTEKLEKILKDKPNKMRDFKIAEEGLKLKV